MLHAYTYIPVFPMVLNRFCSFIYLFLLCSLPYQCPLFFRNSVSVLHSPGQTLKATKGLERQQYPYYILRCFVPGMSYLDHYTRSL